MADLRMKNQTCVHCQLILLLTLIVKHFPLLAYLVTSMAVCYRNLPLCIAICAVSDVCSLQVF